MNWRGGMRHERDVALDENKVASRSLQMALLLGVAKDMTRIASKEALKTATEALEAMERTRKRWRRRG